MSDYRRNRVPGGTYFFTITLHDRNSDLLVTQIALLRDAARQVKTKWPFHIDAWVVLPEHTHCLWTLPENDTDYSNRLRLIKAAFSKALPPVEQRSSIMIRRNERGIWQHRFWEHTIRDDRDYAAHMDYIHFNPVKHGLVRNVEEWPYSSFRHCVAKGIYPPGWVAKGDALADAGERR